MNYLKKFPKGSNVLVLVVVLLAVIATVWVVSRRDAQEESGARPVDEISAEINGSADPADPIDDPEEEPTPQWPVLLTRSQANSLTVVVNKKHKLPSDFVPTLKAVAGGQMRSEAANALAELLADADGAGVPMTILSSYRSYSTQASTYNKWVAQDGQATADTYSARPGHSEHQTGLAVDLGNGTCDLETCFGNTAAGKWLAAHAYEYGFIIRYEEGKDSITGYQYEPWHLRYVGSVASAIVNSGKTMDEYYNIPAGGY